MDYQTPKTSVTEQVNQLKNENAYLLEQLENIKKDKARLELANSETEDEVQVQKSIIREAQMTIHLHQQDIQHWMGLADYYQVSCIRCSDALGKMIAFAQNVKSEVPAQTTY